MQRGLEPAGTAKLDRGLLSPAMRAEPRGQQTVLALSLLRQMSNET